MIFDVVHASQVAVVAAKSNAERARRDFEFRRRTEKQELQERLGEELARLQEGLAKAKAKAATDISRAQVCWDNYHYRGTYLKLYTYIRRSAHGVLLFHDDCCRSDALLPPSFIDFEAGRGGMEQWGWVKG